MTIPPIGHPGLCEAWDWSAAQVSILRLGLGDHPIPKSPELDSWKGRIPDAIAANGVSGVQLEIYNANARELVNLFESGQGTCARENPLEKIPSI